MLENLIDSVIRRERLEEKRPVHLWAHDASVESPDGVVGTCARAVYYRLKGYPNSNEKGSALATRIWLGNMLADAYEKVFMRAGILEGREVRTYYPEGRVSGSMDFVIRLDGELVGVELKAYYGSAAKAQIEGLRGPPSPRVDDLLQVFVYLLAEADRIKLFKLLYQNMAEGKRVIFDVALTSDEDPALMFGMEDGTLKRVDYIRRSSLLRRMNYVLDHFYKDIKPKRDYELYYSDAKIEELFKEGKLSKTKYNAFKKNPGKNRPGDFYCSYCRYKNTCWSDND